MNHLVLEATAFTPYINFNAETGVMEIKGRSIPDQPDDFWIPVLNWFETYMASPSASTEFSINLEYFNISSSKRILFLLYKLNDIVKSGKDAKVSWLYRENDEDMYEVGHDYAYMVKVPFEFQALAEAELDLV